jgi:hypothetical protein
VSFGETGGADARVMYCAHRESICVDARQQGTPRGRWSMAHELGHWLLHRALGADALDRIHARRELTGVEHRLEREVDIFGEELLMPEVLFAPRCDGECPRVPDLDALGREFGTSLAATGKRYAALATRAACAFIECRDRKVKRATRSRAFRGAAIGGRELEPTTMAAALTRGESVSGAGVVRDSAVGSRGARRRRRDDRACDRDSRVGDGDRVAVACRFLRRRVNAGAGARINVGRQTSHTCDLCPLGHLATAPLARGSIRRRGTGG